MSFDKLMDATEKLDDLLDDGPGVKPLDSHDFLSSVKTYAEDIAHIAKTLTVADVDAEFTDEDDNEREDLNGEEESPN